MVLPQPASPTIHLTLLLSCASAMTACISWNAVVSTIRHPVAGRPCATCALTRLNILSFILPQSPFSIALTVAADTPSRLPAARFWLGYLAT